MGVTGLSGYIKSQNSLGKWVNLALVGSDGTPEDQGTQPKSIIVDGFAYLHHIAKGHSWIQGGMIDSGIAAISSVWANLASL